MPLSLALFGLPGWALAEDPLPPDVGARPGPREFEQILGEQPREVRALWRQARTLEDQDRFIEAAEEFQRVMEHAPKFDAPYWRTSRAYWMHGEHLSYDNKPEREQYFVIAEDWAARGLGVNDECAPCMLWKFISMGRLATTRGVMSAASSAAEMGRLLERAIALKPTYADGPENTTLGNLYFSGAKFYRIIPDWFWIRFVIGVRGDKERSLDYARRAVKISNTRMDYQLELGVSLLCFGGSRDEPERIDEGKQVLRRLRTIRAKTKRDKLSVEHARMLLAAPDRACSYSRDGWIELGSEGDLKQEKL